jgi:cytoskeletal protein CcmA (bactofilin family)
MANTVIGSTIVIDGEITGDEDLIVQGTVKGRVGLRQNIYVEDSGVVEANVETATITILGTVTGDIQATERAELKSNCRVVGDIRAPRVLIADGASFKGNVDMDGG